MTTVLMLVYLVYLVGLGQAWHRFLVRPLRWHWTHLAWSFGLGTVLWAYTLFLLNIFNLSTEGVLLYLWQMLLLLIPAAGDLFVRRPLQLVVSSPPIRPVRWVNSLTLFLVGVAALTAALQALAYPMHMWDSIVIYGFKAKILFQEHTFKTDAFMDPSVLHFSADYPLLIPYLEAGFYRWLGHTDDRVVRLLFLVYWGSWLGILYDALAARIRRDYAGLLISLIATLPLFSNTYMGQAVSGFADIPLAFYWTGFFICGCQVWRDGLGAPRSMMALFAMGCVFSKNEGLLAAIVGGALLIGADRSPNRRVWAAPVSVGIVMLLPWLWLRRVLPHNSAHYARMLHLSFVPLAGRLQLIGASFAKELIQIHSWGLFWPLLLLGIVWPARRLPFPKESKVLLAAAGIQWVSYAYIYLTYPQSLELLVPITLLRLLIHPIGLLTLAVGWRLRE